MIVIDKDTAEVYFGKKGTKVRVSEAFWSALINGKVSYRDGGEDKKDGTFFTVVKTFDIKAPDFESEFEAFMNTALGVALAQSEVVGDFIG